MVSDKGVREEVVDCVLQKLESASHAGTDITMKSDQEESTVALKRAVAARRSTHTAMVESQVRVPRTNPKVERAVGKWRAQFRKLKLHVESMVACRIPQVHPMVAWLVEWSAEVVLKLEIKAKGCTRYEELTGHRARHKVLAFGERVNFLPAKDDTRMNKFDGEWMSGYFAGVTARIGEYLVVRGKETYRCPTNRSGATGDQFTNNVLQEGDQHLQLPDAGPREYIPRRPTIRRNNFDIHRFKAGCPECARMQSGSRNRRPHTAGCRAIMEAMMRDIDRVQVQAADVRIETWMAQRIDEGAAEEPRPQQEAEEEDVRHQMRPQGADGDQRRDEE